MLVKQEYPNPNIVSYRCVFWGRDEKKDEEERNRSFIEKALFIRLFDIPELEIS